MQQNDPNNYGKKNKISGIIALILICLFLAKITYGLSIVFLIIFTITRNKINKEEIEKKNKK